MLRSVNARPVAENLFETVPAPRLIGARHRNTGRLVFPAPAERDAFETVELPRHGQLWSYTVQRFAPKSPPYGADAPFRPFAVGYIELAGALIVESPLVEVAFGDLQIGMAMELTTFVLRHEHGNPVLMFAFRPPVGPAA
jgi:uncharacterized OB-fold protein